jgi:hypothetical protein
MATGDIGELSIGGALVPEGQVTEPPAVTNVGSIHLWAKAKSKYGGPSYV